MVIKKYPHTAIIVTRILAESNGSFTEGISNSMTINCRIEVNSTNKNLNIAGNHIVYSCKIFPDPKLNKNLLITEGSRIQFSLLGISKEMDVLFYNNYQTHCEIYV